MKTKIVSVLLIVMMALTLAACASKPAAPAGAAPEAKKAAIERERIDYAFADAGLDYDSELMKAIAESNYNYIRTRYNLQSTDKIVIAQYKSSRSRDQAWAVALNRLAAEMALDLKKSVIAVTGADLNDTEMLAVFTSAMRAKVDIVGQEKVAEYWIKTREKDNDTGKRTDYYSYYIIYRFDESVYGQMVNNYLKQVIKNIDDEESRKRIGSLAAELREGDRNKSADTAAYQAQLERVNKVAPTPIADTEEDQASIEATETLDDLDAYLS